MGGRIPQQFIDDLLSRTDIVEIVDHYVPLKKTGSNYVARCPFHQEKTPSFTVSQEKQFYHCFGCGAHGSAIGFLMAFERLEFVDAIHDLAKRAGIQVPTEGQSNDNNAPSRELKEKLFELLTVAAQHFRRQLKHHAQSTEAIDYLKRRGLSGEVAADFGIGFAPAGWDNLLTYCREQGFDENQLLGAGLIVARENESGYYDRFRHRIMFPIRDPRGRVIGFGGRVLNDETPKYLNSPETVVFHKGQELYGLYEARKAIRDLNQIIVVEGYMDVVALAQFGVREAVATLGTAATTAHIEKLFRVAPKVVFCFDGDRAGRDAAWRALEHAIPALREGVEARFMFLPDGEDPDSLVRKIGKDEFLRLASNAEPFSSFLFSTLSANIDLSSLDGRARLIEKSRSYLDKLPDGVFKKLMTDELANRAKTSTDRLGIATRETSRPSASAPRASGSRSLVRSVVEQLLHNPALAQLAPAPDTLRQAPLTGIDFLCDLLDFLKSRPNLTTGAIVEHWRDTDIGSHLDRLAQKAMLVPAGHLDREFIDAIDKIRGRVYSKQVESLLQKPLSSLSAQEREELRGALEAKSMSRALSTENNDKKP